MLKAVGLFAIAAYLAVGFALAQPSHNVVVPPANSGEAKQQSSGAERDSSQAQSVVVNVIGTPHTHDDSEAAPTNNKEKHKLDGKLVQFTGLLVIVGFLQFAAIAIQAIFLGLAFQESRKASVTAGHAADAADRTAHALIAAQRAYVVVKDFVPIESNANPPGAHVVVVWMNTGTTPTQNLRTWISWEPRNDPLPDDFNFPDINRKAGEEATESFLGPKSEINALTLFVSRDEMIAIREGGRRIYIWGWAEYSDVFPGTPLHRTEFCNEIVAAPIPGNPNALILQFRICPRHNTAT